MTNILTINKKTLALAVLLAGLFISLSIMQVQAAANNSSITLKKDPGTGLFTLTIKDPDGIQEFSMKPASSFPYGGGLSGCPTSFVSNNVLFIDPSDFEPKMQASVIDCHNNTAELQIAPPKDGLTKSAPVIQEAPPPPPPAPQEEPKPEKKGGPTSSDDIIYPVKELGDCQTEAECRGYCDNSQHAKECFAFAKKYKLLSEKELDQAKEQFFSVNNGPGGCSSGAACETYCNSTGHLDECIKFAEDNGYYTGDELAQAKKYQEILKTGKSFPGGCKDRNACEIYCNDRNHMEECINFAEDTGFMSKDEVDEARKILPLMQRGETPGGCTSKEQCEKYCSEESHNEECIAFGEKAGLISPEDAAMIKKTGGKGPGGCHSKQQCEAYCEVNGDECFQWAQDNGFITEADLSKMKDGLSKFKEQLDKIPPEVVQCLKDAVGEKNFEKLVNGQPVFDRSLEGKMKSCFSQITAQFSKQLNTLPPEATQCIKDVIGEEALQKLQNGETDEGIDFSSLEGCFQQLQSSFGGGPGSSGGPGGGFSGPGGCKSIDECQTYCQDHMDECQKFAPPGGGGQGGPQGGPGGCKSQEECQEYCKDHQEECQNFTPPGGGDNGGDNSSDNSNPFGKCLTDRLGEETVQRYVDHARSDQIMRVMNACEQLNDLGGKGDPNAACKNREECQAECAKSPEKCKEFGDTEQNCNADFTGKEDGYWNGSDCVPYPDCKVHPEECVFGPNPTPSPTPPPYGGPGGCQSQEECMAYCQAHYADPACGGGSGGMPPPSPNPSPTPVPPPYSGPGGCTTPAECTAYCTTHYTDPACGGGMPSPTPTPSPTPPPAQSCANTPSGLVSAWNGDSLSGAVGGVTTVSGKVGQAFKFDGHSGYISIGNPANLNFGTGPFSLEAWFNWTGEGAGQVVNNIIRKSNYGPGAGSGYWLRIGQQLEFSVGATTQSEGQTLITASISSGAWHHAVATKDTSGNMQLYVDGQSRGTIVQQSANTQSTSGSSFAIGAWPDGNSEFFHGLIDEVAVYNRALSASEVQTIFSAGSSGKCQQSSAVSQTSLLGLLREMIFGQ